MATIRDLFQPFITKFINTYKNQSGWTEASAGAYANAFVDDVINNYVSKSTLLSNQLINLANSNWEIDLSLDGSARTSVARVQGQPSVIQIPLQTIPKSYNEINTTGVAKEYLFNDMAAIFVGRLAHELGHAEDLQSNTIDYVGSTAAELENGLSVGAQVAQRMIAEGKALYNNIKIAQDIYNNSSHALKIPVVGSPDAIDNELNYINQNQDITAIILGANNFYNSLTSGTSTRYIEEYWNSTVTTFYNSHPQLANQNVLNALSPLAINPFAIDISQVRPPLKDANGFVITNYVTFAPNFGATTAQNTITMTVQFNDTYNVSSYINTFGGYGAIAASADGTHDGDGVVNINAKSPSPPGVLTGQIFNYKAGVVQQDGYTGGSLVDLYNWNGYSEGIIRYSQGYTSLNDVPTNLNDSHIVFSQLNQEDEQGQVTSSVISGIGVIATLSNVANIVLNEGAKAKIIGTNNVITLHGDYDADHPHRNSAIYLTGADGNAYAPSNNVIHNFRPGDKIDLFGITSAVKIMPSANGVLTLQDVNNNTLATLNLAPSPYLGALNFSVSGSRFAEITATLKAGYTIVESTDGNTPDAIAATIAARYGMSTDVLKKINAVFDDTAFAVGNIVHVPVSVPFDVQHLGNLPSGLTYVFNWPSLHLYAVGSSLDGHDSGKLIIDAPTTAPTFDKGTFSSVSANANNGDITVGLTTANGVAVGSIVLNLTSNAGTFYLSSGYSIPVSNISVLNVTAPATSSPIDAAVNYLGQFGTQVSQQELSNLNDAFLNPAGSEHTVTGVVTNTSTSTTDSATETFNLINAAPGAVVQGSAQVTITNYVTVYNEFNQPVQQAVQVNVTPTHILNASGNISQDSISNIDVLNVVGGNITLTAAQLASFGDVRGSGTVTAASAGVYDFRASNISGTFNTITATSWNGTTIYGNNLNGQVLKASAFGNDTLVAGDGTNVSLYAGGGVNTLIGGNGGNAFYANGGLAAGSVITGHGLNNILYASGNISGATVTGVQTLITNGAPIALNEGEFNAFSSIDANTVVTGTGGIYDFNGKFAGAVNVLVGSDAGTEIITNDYVGNTVKTSAFGNDTLIGGAGIATTLSANDSHGNNTLVSNGLSNTLSANNSTGNNHLTANGGGFQILSANRSSGNNVLLTDNGSISVDDSSGNNTLTAAAGILTADNSSGNNVINTVGGMASANNSFGDNILNAANGSARADYSSGNNHLSVTDGFASADYSDGFNILNSVSGTLSADNSTGNNTLTSTSGSVRANASFGNNTLSTDSGNASVSNSFGDNVLTSVTGSLDASGSDGNNQLTTGNGGVSANNSRGNNTLHVTSGNATADYSGGNNNLSATNANGSYLTARNSTGNNTLSVGNGGHAELHVSESQGDNTLTAGIGDGNWLDASSSSGNNTLTAGDGNSVLLYAIDSTGNNALTAGNGNNIVLLANNSSGNNSLSAGNGNGIILSAFNSSGNNVLAVGNGNNNSLIIFDSHGQNILVSGTGTGANVNLINSTGDNTITSHGSDGLFQAYGATGNNTFTALEGNNNRFDLNSTTGNNTLTVGDGNQNYLNAITSTGHNTYVIGNGSNNTIETGTGVSTIAMGTGDNNLVFSEYGLAAGSSIVSQNYTTSILQANGDITGATISGVATLNGTYAGPDQISGVKLTADQFAGFKSIHVGDIYAATTGTYDLTSKDSGSGATIHALATSGTTLIIGNQQHAIASAAGNDTLIANGINGLLDANNTSGNNTLTGGANGSNTLSTQNSTGNNTLVVLGGAINTLDATGSTGHNILDASLASPASFFVSSNFLYAGNGGDTLIGSAGADNITGGNGSDTITGNGGQDYIDAGAGDDTVTYDQASAFILGGSGNDRLLLNQNVPTTVDLSSNINQVTGGGQVSGFESVDGSASSGALTILGDVSANIIKGGSGDDVINGGVGADTISGGAGDDTITFDSADISIDGGTGIDTLVVNGSSAVSLDLSNSINQSTDAVVVTGFENVDASAATGLLSLIGSDGDNILKGGTGADSIFGGAGNDKITYGANDLIIDGGTGIDTLVLNQSSATVVDLNNTINQVAGGSTVINFENVDGSVSAGALTITGDANANSLIGGSGDDIIDGGAGADTIIGGAGNDIITYDSTDISIDGGSGNNTLVIGGNTAITAFLASSINQISGSTVVTGFENIDASANTASVTIFADSLDNILKGGSGADTIYGMGGNDTITYDAVDVSIDGGSGSDTVIFTGSNSITVNLGNTSNQVTGSTFVTGFENIDAAAVTGNTSLTGDAGTNSIKGGSGNDIIIGSGGADSIYGNAGNDIITYNSADLVEDGGAGNDTLLINNGALSINIGNPSGQIFVNATPNQYIAGFETIDASASTGNLFVSGQLNGTTVKGGAGNDQYSFTDTALTGTIIGGGGIDVLQVNGDITGASISGVNTLLSTGGVRLTATQLASFNLIASGTHLYAATGGTYDMTGRGTTGDILEATVSTGTTLIAGGTAGQTLKASEFGTDTLSIGNGANDVVIAGKGINIITMGNGANDVVIAQYGLKAGSSVNMSNTTTSTLQVTGDISGATITGVNTLSATGGVTLTSSQLAGFKFVANNSILYAATGGTYSLNGGRGSFGDQLHATVNTGTTLIGGNANSLSLYASASGNDTLTLGTGANDRIYAGAGINIITMGSGAGGRVIANSGLAAGSSVTMGNATDSLLQANGNISEATLSGIHTLSSTTGVIINATQFANFASFAANTSLSVTTGGTYDLTGKGSVGDTLTALANTGTTLIGNADGQTLVASANGHDTLIAGNGNNVTLIGGNGGNTLTGGNGVNTIMGGAGNDVIVGGTASDIITGGGGDDIITYDAVDLSVDGGSAVDTLVLNGATPITANLANSANQVSGSVIVTGFENLDASSVTADVYLTGDAGANSLIGGSGNDIIAGGGGADTLLGGAGNDTIGYDSASLLINGGIGTDTLAFTNNAALTVDLGNGVNQVTGSAIVTGFENVDASAATGAVTLIGDAGDNTLKAGSGNDTVWYDAADTLEDGGVGNDTLRLNNTADLTVDLTATADQVLGGGATINFENVDGSASIGALTLTGDAGANILIGGTGNDTIIGGGGADSIYAGIGDDTVTYDGAASVIEGGDGYDTLYVAAGTVYDLNNATSQVAGSTIVHGFERIIVASSGATILMGDAGANTLNGGTGDDYIDGLGGADSIYGNEGNDTVVYDATDIIEDGGAGVDTLILSGATAITANLSSATDQITGGGKTINFENIDASAVTANVNFTGSSGSNILIGGSGNDTINAGAGADIVRGSAGNDNITYDAADTIIDGGIGIDTLTITGSGSVTVDLSSSANQITGSGIVTGFEYVTATTMTGNLSVTGDANANTLRGGAGTNTIHGGDGNDSIVGGTGSNTLYGDAGNDSITGGAGIDTIHGGDGNDTINGGIGADSIYGGAGNDSITFDAADTVIDGGDGTDTLVITGTADVSVNLSNSTNQVVGSGIVTGFESITATSLTGTLTLTGDDNANVLRGGGGANIIYAGAGNDSIVGGVGANTLYGEDGNDSITGGANNDSLYGGAGNDTLNGGAGADSIYGGAGNDTITYDAADTIVDGGDDVDTLTITGGGNISIDLSNVTNQVSGSGTVTGFENITATAFTGILNITGSDAVNVLRGGTGVNTISAGAGNDAIIGGSGTSTIHGDDGNDSITGGANSDILYGDAGNDTINGGAGADSIYGGTGNDSISYDVADVAVDGGDDVDTLTITGGGTLTIDLSNTANQVVGTGTVTGFENITATSFTGALNITGSDAVNVLRGGSGVNTIHGGASNDTIIGGASNDLLYGGDGNDSISGVGGNDALNGEGGNDSLTGGDGADILAGGTGTDTLTGGLGNDTYNFARGDGADTIVENDATVGNQDVLVFASGVNYDQLWFKKISNNLEVSVIGSTDKVTISNWFLSTDRQVEAIQAGGQELVNSNVINLVNAMAGMTAPAAGQTTLTAAQHTALDPVIAANWHAA